MTRAVVVHPSADLLAQATADRLVLAALDAQSLRSPVHLVLTGGRIGTRVAEAFLSSPLLAALDVANLHLWWGDERFRPHGHEERNDTAVLGVLADGPIPAANVHAVPGPDQVADPEAAATAYAAELATFAPAGQAYPAFDVLLLGVGPDGHVASLFPGHPALAARGATVGVHGSPKPPPERVSLTQEAIDGARRVWLVAAGAEKAEAVAAGTRALARTGTTGTGPSGTEGEPLPCARVHGSEETLWLLDVAAAGTEAAGT